MDIYGEWGISRTRHKRADGFLGRTYGELNPMVIQESLGENSDMAWQLGEAFALKYPDRSQRAERIFYFVRDRVATLPITINSARTSSLKTPMR